MLDKILRTVEKYIPKNFTGFFSPPIIIPLAFASALLYRFPGRKIFVLGVTGTKGQDQHD